MEWYFIAAPINVTTHCNPDLLCTLIYNICIIASVATDAYSSLAHVFLIWEGCHSLYRHPVTLTGGGSSVGVKHISNPKEDEFHSSFLGAIIQFFKVSSLSIRTERRR